MVNSKSLKLKRFIQEYPIDCDGTAAAKRAGYSAKTAQEQASRLLSNVMVRREIDAKLAKIGERCDLTADRIRAQVLALLTFDPRKAYNTDGTLKSMSEMPDDIVIAITAIESDDATGDTKKIKFTDRTRAVELGAKMLGMLKLELTGKNGSPLIPPSSVIDFSGMTTEELKEALENHARTNSPDRNAGK